MIIGKDDWLNLFWEYVNRKLYALQVGEGATLGVFLALRIGEGELEVGEKGSADPAGRIELAGGPLWVSLPSQV